MATTYAFEEDNDESKGPGVSQAKRTQEFLDLVSKLERQYRGQQGPPDDEFERLTREIKFPERVKIREVRAKERERARRIKAGELEGSPKGLGDKAGMQREKEALEAFIDDSGDAPAPILASSPSPKPKAPARRRIAPTLVPKAPSPKPAPTPKRTPSPKPAPTPKRTPSPKAAPSPKPTLAKTKKAPAQRKPPAVSREEMAQLSRFQAEVNRQIHETVQELKRRNIDIDPARLLAFEAEMKADVKENVAELKSACSISCPAGTHLVKPHCRKGEPGKARPPAPARAPAAAKRTVVPSAELRAYLEQLDGAIGKLDAERRKLLDSAAATQNTTTRQAFRARAERIAGELSVIRAEASGVRRKLSRRKT